MFLSFDYFYQVFTNKYFCTSKIYQYTHIHLFVIILTFFLVCFQVVFNKNREKTEDSSMHKTNQFISSAYSFEEQTKTRPILTLFCFN